MQIHRIRTTITLPLPLHRKLKEEALDKGKSLNKLVLEKLEDKKGAKAPFKVKTFNVGVRGSLRRKDIYEDILKHRV